jgi:hypothetical protein
MVNQIDVCSVDLGAPRTLQLNEFAEGCIARAGTRARFEHRLEPVELVDGARVQGCDA